MTIRATSLLCLALFGLSACGDDDGEGGISASNLVDGIYQIEAVAIEDDCNPARGVGEDMGFLFKIPCPADNSLTCASLAYFSYFDADARRMLQSFQVGTALDVEFGCGPQTCAGRELSGCTSGQLATYVRRFAVTEQSHDRLVGTMEEEWGELIGCTTGATPETDCSATREFTYTLMEECEPPCTVNADDLSCHCPE